MKMLMAIGAILLFVKFSSSDFIAKCASSNEAEMKENEASINVLRSQNAITLNIANMHELKYDLELEKEIQKMKSCYDRKSGTNYNYQDNNVAALTLIDYLKNNNFTVTWYPADKLHPVQTAFAFCELTEPCHNVFGSPENVIYIYGPKNTSTASDFIYGPPGSLCSNGKTELNLCKDPEITTTTTTTTEEPTTKKEIPMKEVTKPLADENKESVNEKEESATEGREPSNHGTAPMNSILMYFPIALMIIFV